MGVKHKGKDLSAPSDITDCLENGETAKELYEQYKETISELLAHTLDALFVELQNIKPHMNTGRKPPIRLDPDRSKK
jgi:hypothetical protein